MKGFELSKHYTALVLVVLILSSLFVTGSVAGQAGVPTATLIKGSGPGSNEPAQRVYFVSHSKSEQELITIQTRLVDAGARAISLIIPDAIVCELPLRVDPASLLDGTGVIARTQPLDGRTIAPALPGDLEWLRTAYDIHEARKSGLEPERNLSYASGVGDLMEVSRAAIERSAVLADLRLQQSGGVEAGDALDERLPDQNAEFLAGNVHIQIVFLEMKDSGSWTTSEQSAVQTAIEIVKMYFEQQFRNLKVNFSSRIFEEDVGWDPIENALVDEIGDIRPLIDDVMTRMEYLGTPGEYLDRVNRFNNDARAQYRTADWVFTIFVVDSSHDPDYSFAGRKQVYAQLGGPFMIMAYPAVSPGISNFEQYFKHAMTTIFWGMPEDKGATPGTCGSRSGYLNIRNGNKVFSSDPLGGSKDCDNEPPDPCIAMLRDVEFGYTGAPCDFTKGQLGNKDADGDNVPDIFDAPPSVVFSGPAIDTLTSLNDPVKFSIRTEAVPNNNSQQQHVRRNYATKIERVSYMLNGIGPIVVVPVDGITDEAIEDYNLKINFLLPGTSYIDITAWNNFGAKSSPRTKEIFYVGLDFWSFRFEHRNEGTGIAWYLRGTTFDARLVLHRIDYADTTDTIIAGHLKLQPIRPEKDGLTPYFFLDKTAAPGKLYGYYIKGNFDLNYSDGTSEPFSSSSAVFNTVGAIPRSDGILSVPAPNPFRPAKGAGKLLVSINIPGAEGVPLFSQGGISAVSAQQQQAPEPVNLRVGVYDVAGREVRILFDDAIFDMVKNIEWDGNNTKGRRVPSGMYFIKARAGETSDTKKVLVIR